MKRLIKITCMCLALTMLLSMFLGNMPIGEVETQVIGCGKKKIKLYEYGDFIITEDNELYDISDSGLQKEYLIIPETINGKEVSVFQYPPKSFMGQPISAGFRYSEKIKKIYANRKTGSTGFLCYEEKTEDKLFLINNKYKKLINPKVKLIGANYTNEKTIINNMSEFVQKIYAYFGGCIPRAYIEKEMFNETDFFKNYYYKMANIEFLYNYENAPNYGCYWIDDLETGETLAYMPPNPTREGYTFDGWYADSECTIEYDFATPYVKKDLIEGVYDVPIKTYEGIRYDTTYYLLYPEDYVTHLYAKWI